MKIAGIDHIVLRTDRLDAMLHFYCDILGCAVERSVLDEYGLIQLRAGSALIDIVTVDGPLGLQGGPAPTDKGLNMDHFCLQLEPISEEELTQFLVSKGLEVGEFANRYGAQGRGPSIYLKDPQGNTVELKSQPLAGSAAV